MTSPQASTIRRLLGFLVPHRGTLLVAIFCMVLYAIFNAASLYLIKPVLDGVIFTKAADVVFVIPYIGLTHTFQDRMQFLTFISIAIAVAYFFRAASAFGQEYLMTRIGMRILQRVRNDLFRKYTRIPIEYLEGQRAGKLLSINLNDVGLIYSALIRMVTDTILQPIVILFLVLVAVTIVPPSLALAAFIVLPFIGGLIAFFGRKMKRATHGTQSQIENFTQVLQEKIGGMKIVRIFGQEEAECARFGREVDGYFKWSMKQAKISSISGPLMMFLGGLGVAVAIYYGGYLAISKTVSAGSFGVFVASVISIYKPIKNLTNLNNTYQQGAAAAERIFGFLDASEAPDVDIGREARFERDLAFHSVRFRYNGTPTDVLDGIEFTVKKGEHVAFVGISGIGKTTLLMLIPRLLEPTSGVLTLDGVSFTELSPRSLRNLMAAVVQDVVLFNDTIAANIRYGRPDASDAEVEEAARAADAHEFIVSFPQGYHTLVGERGAKLSGGQRQRVAIARAFLKNAPILILDEATSNLDSESEREVQKTVERLASGRTTLVVAHRLSTIRRCDRIYLIENGRISDSGAHDDLMSRSAAYRAAVALQSI